MLRASPLLIAALAFAVPASAIADTKAEKAAKKKKNKKKKKAKTDDQDKADLEAAEAEAAAAEAAAAEEEAKPDAEDADLLKTKAATDAEEEAAKAAADQPEEEQKPEPEPEPVATVSAFPRLLVGKGRLVIAGSTVNVNTSTESVGKPISFAPSIWYGISDKLSVGVTHDGGTTNLSPRPGVRVTTADLLGTIETTTSGAGICVTGDMDGNCPKPYDNVGADVLIGIADGKLSLAAHIGVDVLSIDEMTIGARLGALGRFALASKVGLVFDPRIQIAATDREFTGDSLDIPLWVWFDASPKLGLYVHTGFSGPFDGLGDSFNVPVGVGASIHASSKLTLGADFHFSNLLGKGSSADGRVLGLRLAVTL